MLETIKLQNALADEKAKIARIKGELKTEYQDFISAVDTEMTVDLGENMREQIKNIFFILAKEGITF